MNDHKFFTILTASALALWLFVQSAINVVYAASEVQEPPRQIVFTATVGVGVVVDESISGGTVVFESEPH